MKLTKPDQVTGFKDVYLSGTHFAAKVSKSTKAADSAHFRPIELMSNSNKVVSFADIGGGLDDDQVVIKPPHS